MYQTFKVLVAPLANALFDEEDCLSDDYLSYKHLLSLSLPLNRFSSKLRYIFCMLIFFQVLLEINNGKDYFLKKEDHSEFFSFCLHSERNFLKQTGIISSQIYA